LKDLSDSVESGKTIEVGKVYKAKVIQSTAGTIGGKALAKIYDFTVTLSSARVEEGDEVRVKITSVTGNTATANLVTNAADIF
jgi:predicted RNA-binding protein with TRAM domain